MKKYIGNREFYKLVAVLALPLLLQNLVSTFVNLLDNLMVGRIGTESMSGVSIVNQILFVYNLCLFGGAGGAGIFGAQFYGKGDHKGVAMALRFNLLLCAAFSAVALTVLSIFPERLVGSFLHDSETGGDLVKTLMEGTVYLRVMLWGLPAFAVTTAYVSILRVTGDNKLPMRASVTAIGVNLLFNWLLIYGKLGFPCLGVKGAAIATVLSRYVELGLILLGTHGKKQKPLFLLGLFREFRISLGLAGSIIRRGLPLLVNEGFWSLGMTTLTQCYSWRGLEAVAALNINSVVLNLFNTFLFTMGSVVGIILGNLLGAEEFDRARDYCPKLISLSMAFCAAAGILLIFVSPVAPELYNTSDSIRHMAAQLMRVCGVMLPMHAVVNCCYWALRAGGKTYITMLFDSVFCWVVAVPTAWGLIHWTALPLLSIYICVNLTDIIKAVIGGVLVRKGIWVNNFVTEEST